MDQEIPLINSHENKSRSCISVMYNMTVLGFIGSYYSFFFLYILFIRK